MPPSSLGLPAMAGAPGSNGSLDDARVLARVPAPDNLAWQDDHLLLSSGHEILLISDVRDGEVRPDRILRFEHPVSSLASASDGTLAIGLGRGGLILVGGARDGLRLTTIGGRALACPTALAFAGPDILLLCHGSALHEPGAWRSAEHATGSVWRIDLGSGAAACLGEGLAFPSGVLALDGGRRIAVSESGRGRILAFGTIRAAMAEVLLDGLRGHPGRLSPAAGAGAWLSVSAAGASAPAPAHDLAIRLDAHFQPVASLHGERCHSVASCLEIGGELLVACKEDDVVLAVDVGWDAGARTDRR